MPDARLRSGTAVAIALAAGSALAASTHEVVWGRLLGRAVGNTSYGVGLTLGLFMLGLGAGTLVAPKLGPLWRRPHRGFAIAEIVIALGAAAVLGYCLLAPPPSAVGAVAGRAGLALDIAAAGLVTMLPALAMGTSYPFLVECVARRRQDAAAVTGLYLAGLVGAVAGTLITAVWIAPARGLDVASAAAVAVNLAIAACALALLPRATAGHEPTPSRAWPAAEDREPAARFAAAGALGLGAQVVWNRCLVPYAGTSTLTFALIVAAYVLAQAAGFLVFRSVLSASERLRVRGPDLALVLAAPVILLSLGATAAFATALPNRDVAPLAWLASVALVVVAAVVPGALLLGISQAGALAVVETRSGSWGNRAASVAGVGTIASAAGAVAAVLIGVPLIGPWLTLVALGAGAPLALLPRAGLRLAAVSVVLSCAAAWLPVGPRWFLGSEFDRAPALFTEHGIQDTTAIVTVDQPVEPLTRRLVANGVAYSGDSLVAERYMRLLAHLPALAARGEQRALVICVGTGMTLDSLRRYEYQRIDAVDISPSVRSTLQFFEHVNHGAASDPRVELINDDGARFLRRTDRRYDVITLEPPPPRAPGASSLYSIEFYRAARRRLAPGGALAQWLPLHGLSSEDAAGVTRTFLEVFPDASLHYAERKEAILVGSLTPPSDELRSERLRRPEVRSDLARVGYGELDPWTDSLVLSGERLRQSVAAGEVIRDAWPFPEYAGLRWARRRQPLDRILQRFVADASEHGAAASAGLQFAIAAPALIRMQEGRAGSGDGAAVQKAMLALLVARPEDPYLQHIFGFGPLLEERLDRLGAEIDASREQRTRDLMRTQEERVRRRLAVLTVGEH